jgi:hypothetical protein
MNEENPYADLVGSRVIVIWTDKAYWNRREWVAFRILDAGIDSLWLQGVASPDGSKHDGTKCHALVSEIREIIEWKEDK